MKETKLVEGYVIHLSQYKENDFIVTFLTREGLITFRARGAKKITSKNASCLLLLSYSSCFLENFNDSWNLKEGKCLQEPSYRDDLKVMSSLSFIAEITSKLVMEDIAQEAYLWLEEAMESIKKGFSPLTSALLLFARYIKLEGYGLDVDECVYCRKKGGIIGVDFEEGGFVCENEDPLVMKRMSARYLSIYRYIFRCKVSDFTRVDFFDKECLEIIEDLAEYIYHNLGISFKTLKTLSACN